MFEQKTGSPDPFNTPPGPPPLSSRVYPGAKPPAWPLVVGIIATVLGGLGILGGLVGLATPWFTGLMRNFAPPGQRATFEVIERWMPWSIAGAAINLCLAIALLTAGILLIRRRRAGATATRVWAVVKIPWEAAYAFVQYLMLQDQHEILNNDYPGMRDMMTGFMNTAQVAGLVISALVFMAFPVFVLAWFSREKIRDHVETWR